MTQRPDPQQPVLVIMGVSGSGKSTVAGILAGQLGWDLEEGDDLHPASNVAKMASGHPADRRRPVAMAGQGRRLDHRAHHRRASPGSSPALHSNASTGTACAARTSSSFT